MRIGKILVVDDEEIIRSAFKKELELAGHEVKTASGGEEAVETARKENFDIVYTDLIMPQMNGIEVSEEINRISPATRIMLITGYPSEAYEQQMVFSGTGGLVGILQKPLLEDELIQTTNTLLEQVEAAEASSDKQA